jgi:hypothetical protein
MVMPAVIGRDQLQKLTGEAAQLVEVLPAEDYEWAHLPGTLVGLFFAADLPA